MQNKTYSYACEAPAVAFPHLPCLDFVARSVHPHHMHGDGDPEPATQRRHLPVRVAPGRPTTTNQPAIEQARRAWLHERRQAATDGFQGYGTDRSNKSGDATPTAWTIDRTASRMQEARRWVLSVPRRRRGGLAWLCVQLVKFRMILMARPAARAGLRAVGRVCPHTALLGAGGRSCSGTRERPTVGHGQQQRHRHDPQERLPAAAPPYGSWRVRSVERVGSSRLNTLDGAEQTTVVRSPTSNGWYRCVPHGVMGEFPPATKAACS
jgi:hypothetical protein